MSLQIVPFTDAYLPLVKEFNKRMRDGGSFHQFPSSPVPEWLPETPGIDICQKLYIALDENTVRGGYIIKYQQFYFHGEKKEAGCLQLPFSEGVINKKYSGIGIQVIFDALERKPELYAIGIGSYNENYSKFLLKLKWDHFPVPFFFKVIKPFPFFMNIEYLRKMKKLYSFLADIAAFSFIPGMLIKAFQSVRNRQPENNTTYEVVSCFGEWADELWDKYRNSFSMIAERSSAVLNHLYPEGNKRFVKILIRKNNIAAGWAVLVSTKLKEHKQFGNMNLGTIVDNFSAPGYEHEVINHAANYLIKSGADLIVSNQSNKEWCSALSRSGFIQGPSNYIFFASGPVSRLMNDFEVNKNLTHFNRADGDGPVNI